MSKKVQSGVDYDFVGASMKEIKRMIVATFVGARKRGKRPKPFMCWGRPGVGKTFTVYAAARVIAERLGIPEVQVFNVACSSLEPTDLAGVPWEVKVLDTPRYTSYLPPRWAYLASKEYEEDQRKIRNDPKWQAPPCLMFFDDVPAAHFQTQTAFFKGIQEGMWGDVTQRDNAMCVACGNRPEDNAGASDMPTPLGNRFRHAYAHPKTSDWLEWAGDEASDIHPYVVGYIRQNDDDLNVFDSDIANGSEKAFASARTWEDISSLIWEGEIDHQSDPVFGKMIMGIVGRGVGTKFLAYMRNTNAVIPPTEIVKNPDKARIPSKQNLDALSATIASLEHHVKQHPEHWKAVVKYALREEMVSDFGLLLATTAAYVISNKLSGKERTDAIGDDVFLNLMERYESVLECVNL